MRVKRLSSTWNDVRLSLYAKEWLLLTVFSVAVSVWLSLGQVLQTPDFFVYDLIVRQSSREADGRIIIVAIDDKSLKELGRWPWNRDTHASLLARLPSKTDQNLLPPKGVFLDLLLSEPDPNDASLAREMARLPKVVLPVGLEPFPANGQAAQMLLPVKVFREVTHLGYSGLMADRDGLARRVFMKGVGRTDAYSADAGPSVAVNAGTTTELQHFEHVAVLMAGDAATTRPVLSPDAEEQSEGISWVGPPGSFVTVPYISVLKGEVPKEFFSDRYVLIGATATGLGDRLATPTSAEQGAMAGIEIHANVLDGVLNGRRIRTAPPWLLASFALLPVLLALLAYYVLAPRYALAWTLGLLGGVAIVSVAGLRWAGYWLSPSAACLSLALVYLVWSWRRLEAVLRYFADELENLGTENLRIPELDVGQEVPVFRKRRGWYLHGDILEKQIAALHKGIARIRNLRQFLNDGLESLPIALIITDQRGRILMVNQETKTLFMHAAATNERRTQPLDSTVELALVALGIERNFLAAFEPSDQAVDYSSLQGKELVSPQGLTLQMAVAPVSDTVSASTIGWLFAFVDLSAERKIQAHRADLLRFLSHDLRTPQVSILAMLELQESPGTALSPQELAIRLSKQVRHTLRLTDDFLQLAKAEAHNDYKFEILDLSDLALEAVDQVWPLAAQKNIEIDSILPPLSALESDHSNGAPQPETLVAADGNLLRRAIVNLMHNAIRYSGPYTNISITVKGEGLAIGGHVQLVIEDQGIGISPEDIPLIFERYRRLSKKSSVHPARESIPKGTGEPSLQEPPGVAQAPDQAEAIQGLGLGLTLVKTVIDSHQGSIQCTSTLGKGTQFLITLPRAT